MSFDQSKITETGRAARKKREHPNCAKFVMCQSDDRLAREETHAVPSGHEISASSFNFKLKLKAFQPKPRTGPIPELKNWHLK